MRINLSKRKFHDYLSGLSLKMVVLISQFAVVPIFISNLGIEKYGEWLILTTIPNYLMMSDLGLNQTVTNKLCELIKRNKQKLERIIFNTAFTFLIIISISLLMLFFLGTYFFKINELLNIKVLTERNCIWILGVYILNVCIFLIFRLIIGYFKVLNKFYMHEYMLAITYALDFIFVFLVLYNDYNLVLIPSLLLAIRLVLGVIVVFRLKKKSVLKLRLDFRFKYVLSLLPVSLKLSVFMLGFALLLQGTTLVVGSVLGASLVVVFNTLRTLVNSIRTFSSVLYLPTMPQFAFYMAEKKIAEVKGLLISVTKKVIIASFLFCLFIYFFKDIILRLWLKTEIIYSEMFFMFMLFSVFFHTIWNANSMLSLGVNYLDRLIYYPVIVLFYLGIVFLVIKEYGLISVSIGMFFLDLTMLYIVFKSNKQKVKI